MTARVYKRVGEPAAFTRDTLAFIRERARSQTAETVAALLFWDVARLRRVCRDHGIEIASADDAPKPAAPRPRAIYEKNGIRFDTGAHKLACGKTAVTLAADAFDLFEYLIEVGTRAVRKRTAADHLFDDDILDLRRTRLDAAIDAVRAAAPPLGWQLVVMQDEFMVLARVSAADTEGKT